MRLEDLHKEARRLLSRHASEVQGATAADQTDIATSSQTFFLELFRETFGLPELRDLNADKRNFEALDLGDSKSGTAFQITASPGLDKVTETLRKAIAYDLHLTYPRIRIYIITRRQNRYRKETVDKVTDGKLHFDPRRDIFDYRDLLRLYKTFELDRLEKVVAILRKHLADLGGEVPPPMIEAMERDLRERYLKAVQRSTFSDVGDADAFRRLALELTEGTSAGTSKKLSPALRRRILLRASRSCAVRGLVDEAIRYLQNASALPGPDSDLPAKARLAEAQGDIECAIRLLRDEQDADSRSTLLSILARHQGDEAALTWFKDLQLDVGDVTSLGALALAQIHIRMGQIDEIRVRLEGLLDTQIHESPHLLLIRACLQLASALPKAYRDVALRGRPLIVVHLRPVFGGDELAARLDRAIADSQRLLPIARDLGLIETTRTTETYIAWCELLHPHKHAAALARLRAAASEPAFAVAWPELAFTFDPEFDPRPLETWLARREALGGLNEQELRAALVVRLHLQDEAGIAKLISRHRARYDALLGEASTRMLEIEALARTHDTSSARVLLDTHRGALGAAEIARAEAEIAKCEGADPVTEYLRAYERAKTLDTLNPLVAALAEKGDHLALAKYAEELYGLTGDPRSLALAARALVNAKDDSNFLRLLEAHPDLGSRDLRIARSHGWVLFRLGRLKDASRIADELQEKGDASRDLNLEVAIAIETGDWKALGRTLSAWLTPDKQADGATLTRAAFLAQASGEGPRDELIQAALKVGADDANVLLGAYMMALQESTDEDERPEVQTWFRRALELSGPDGPIQRFEMKDLLNKQLEWSERVRNVNEALLTGNVPLAIAAPALHSTIVDIVVGNLIRNSKIVDPRRRAVVPLYSGRRAPTNIGTVKRIALDVTAALVLGWAGLLPKVLKSFPEVMIPAGLMYELLEGRRRIRQHQKSRVLHAKRVLEAIAKRGLKVLPASNAPPDAFAREIGADLATLLNAARERGGIVVRPAPVPSIGAGGSDADVSAFAAQLTDTRRLLDTLRALSAIDQATEDVAGRYFKLQDPGWPKAAQPQKSQDLYLDRLAVVYLQTTNLLDSVIEAFDRVYVASAVEEEAAEIIEREEHVEEIVRTIDRIREAINDAYRSGIVSIGPRATVDDDDGTGEEASTMHLLMDLSAADTVIVDDRALNNEAFAEDGKKHRARTATSLDLVDDLHVRKIVSDSERNAFRQRLRTASASLMPVESAEVTFAARRSGEYESPEFTAIRQNLALTRVRDVPRFPREVLWLTQLSLAIKSAAIEVWQDEADTQRAAVLADAILDMAPEPVGWRARWEAEPPTDWEETHLRMMTAALALPTELPAATRDAYQAWVERRILSPMRTNEPERYRGMIEYVRTLIAGMATSDAEWPAPMRVLLALSALSAVVRAEVLADASFVSKFDIPTIRPVELRQDAVVSQDTLFEAFRNAADGKPTEVDVNEKEEVVARKVIVAQDGAGLVYVSETPVRFGYAGLLTSEREQRRALFERFLSQHTLAQRLAREGRDLVGAKTLGREQFISTVELLQSSPESFTQTFQQKLRGELTHRDLLPTDVRYWENVTAPWESSKTLRDFVVNELAQERRARLASATPEGLAAALQSIGHTFAAPELVPFDLLQDIDSERLYQAIAIIPPGELDHYTMIGLFEVCAQRLPVDARFAEPGTLLLNELMADPARLENSCKVFATGLTAATVQLSMHAQTRERPVYWRRLAASAHAATVARVCRGVPVSGESFLEWGFKEYGLQYMLSVLKDFIDAPRWRPEWAEARYLTADAFGRVKAAVSQIPEAQLPEVWAARLDSAATWMRTAERTLLSQFPCVLQGERRMALVPDQALRILLRQLYDKLAAEPSDRNLLRLAPIIEALGDASEIAHHALAFVRKLEDPQFDGEPDRTEEALRFAAHVAVLANHVELAQAIVDQCLKETWRQPKDAHYSEVVLRLVECAAAEPDSEAAKKKLATWLEALAFRVPYGQQAAPLVECLEQLQRLDVALAPLLGRAIHAAKLAESRTARSDRAKVQS